MVEILGEELTLKGLSIMYKMNLEYMTTMMVIPYRALEEID